jgi:hypothetical protein
MAFGPRRHRARSQGVRPRAVVVACTLCALLAATPIALGAGEGQAFRLGQRNPSSGSLTKESQVIANIKEGQGGTGANTGGYSTRQSNLSSSGGGAIYGCRATNGNNACIAANNLANGEAFRFEADTDAPDVGEIRFGGSLGTLVNRPPFQTNGTGTVRNLSADKIDGVDSSALLTLTAAAQTYLTKADANATFETKASAASSFAPINVAPYAVVNAAGTVTHGHFTSGNAMVGASGGNTTYTLTFTQNVSTCAATATPSAPLPGGSSIAAAIATSQTVVVTETLAASVGFNLALSCGGS